MRKLFLSALAIVLSFVTVMAAKPEKAGSMVTKVIELDGFKGIVVDEMFNVDVKKGDYFDISVEIAEDLADRLSVKVKDNKLILGLKKKPFNIRFITTRDLFVHIVMPDLTSLKLKGAAAFSSEGSFKTDGDFALDVEGSSTIDGLDISARKVDAEIKGGSTIKMKANAESFELVEGGASSVKLNGSLKTLTAKLKGASTLVLSGATDSAIIDVAGLSNVDAVAMKFGTCKSKVSGLSSLKQF